MESSAALGHEYQTPPSKVQKLQGGAQGHCVVELHLSGLHREKRTKTLLVVCCGFLLLLQIWADWQRDVSQDRLTC